MERREDTHAHHSSYFAIAAIVMRALNAAPELVRAIEDFWNAVTGNPGAPSLVDKAVRAAIAHIDEDRERRRAKE